MNRHPYTGLRATRPASTNPRLPEVSGVVVAVGTASEELEVGALHFTGAVLLLDDGKHKEVPLDSLIVDHAEAAARMAPKPPPGEARTMHPLIGMVATPSSSPALSGPIVYLSTEADDNGAMESYAYILTKGMIRQVALHGLLIDQAEATARLSPAQPQRAPLVCGTLLPLPHAGPEMSGLAWSDRLGEHVGKPIYILQIVGFQALCMAAGSFEMFSCSVERIKMDVGTKAQEVAALVVEDISSRR